MKRGPDHYRSSQRLAAAGLAALGLTWLATTGPDDARAEVVLTPAKGNPIIGGAVKSEDADTVEIEIYRGLAQKIPKKAIAKREDVDRSQRPEREEFDQRRQALKADDSAGGLELANWARAKGLVVQAQGLLLDLQDRFPDHADIKTQAALPAAAERQELAEADKAFLTQQVTAFFAEGGKPGEVIAALQGRDALPAGTADEWARRCLAEARQGRQVAEGDTKFKNGEIESELHIELWRRAPAKAPEAGNPAANGGNPAPADETPWPVLLSLHGGGLNDGHWTAGTTTYRDFFSRHFPKLIFVAPTVMQKNYAEWGGNPAEEFQVKEMLRAVKRTWNVDTDRVYVAGYSMGGYGTWHIGGHNADQFAGLVAGAGGILIGSARGETWGWGIVGNLMHTPIAFIHGGKDEPAPPWSDASCDQILTALATQHPDCYRHKYKLYPDAGHGLPDEGSGESVEWIAQFKRDPYPKKICWEPKRTFNQQFYWLWVQKPQIFTRLEAEIKDNTVRVQTLNLNGGFSILLNRQLVDLGQPVTVEVNGTRVFAGRVPETLSTILATVADRLDERQWFSARLDF